MSEFEANPTAAALQGVNAVAARRCRGGCSHGRAKPDLLGLELQIRE
jgi:hypothetical protein